MSYIDDTRIHEQFEKINSKTSDPPNTTNIPFFNITDKIIDKINDDKYLIKIGFRELLAYASPIVFNRELEQTKIDELYASITNGYAIPFTIDAIYDKKSKIDEKIIKIINGNHRHGAIQKYITAHDKYFSCDYKIYVWIYAVDECETTNVKQSIELYTKINNHLPFKEPIIVDINVMEFLNKLCRQKRFKGLILSNQCETSRQPRINKKELFNLLNTNKDILESFLSKYSVNKNNLIISEDILSQFIENINEINHLLSLKGINSLYSDTQLSQNRTYYEQAVEVGFYLNLKKSNYPKEIWIKYLCNPTDI
uniref:Uncharacterized protein n=1 Tax=viral metagenome TaxID=1070528 RepID=A0A6C0I9C1_9ZZZZ